MKRAEFIKLYVGQVMMAHEKRLLAGEERLSEAVMSVCDAEKSAASLWRKYGAAYRQHSRAELLKALNWTEPKCVGLQVASERGRFKLAKKDPVGMIVDKFLP